MYGVRGLNENNMLCQKYQYVRLAACFLTGHWEEGSWGRGGGGRMPNMKTICGKTPAVVWRDTFEHVRDTLLRVMYARNYKKCNQQMYKLYIVQVCSGSVGGSRMNVQ